jgi:hypothetical protein
VIDVNPTNILNEFLFERGNALVDVAKDVLDLAPCRGEFSLHSTDEFADEVCNAFGLIVHGGFSNTF